MLTLNKINKDLQKTYPDIELIKGGGYFYLCGDSVQFKSTTMICVSKLNNLSLEQWMNAINAINEIMEGTYVSLLPVHLCS